ncbi:MAG: hypothetical protein WCG03_02670 [Kiritimatiellales bacterium]
MNRTFVGFGFGAIQSGLFLYEAYRSGNFNRLVVAEVVPDVVESVRRNGGYALNVATPNGIEQHQVTGLEIYNPAVNADRLALLDALAEAQEVATALPSVDFFTRGDVSVAALLRAAFLRKLNNPAGSSAVVYTGENNNHAAEILEEAVGLGKQSRVQFLNTVIGKMSGVVTDPLQIKEDGLAPMTPGSGRAFLVEAFNSIFITQITLPGFERGISVFSEKSDLLPFEEAKLYGHNAVHALLGYLANERECVFMSDAPDELIKRARTAFLKESGAALIKKYAGIDPLFTPAGFKDYADDLMERMLNPYLRDQVAREIRDPERKLGRNDRLIGTLRLIRSQQLDAPLFLAAAEVALKQLEKETPASKTISEVRDYLQQFKSTGFTI